MFGRKKRKKLFERLERLEDRLEGLENRFGKHQADVNSYVGMLMDEREIVPKTKWFGNDLASFNKEDYEFLRVINEVEYWIKKKDLK